MKRIKRQYALAACACVMFFSLAATTGASNIGAVVKKACSRCHSTKRICLNVGVKSEAAWKATIRKMVGKGAKLPVDRIDAAATYLSNLAPGSGSVCQ